MGKPVDQAHKPPSRLTANGPDSRGRIIAVIKLEHWTGLKSGTLLDDRLCESFVAVNENLQNRYVNSDILLSFYSLRELTVSRSPRETRITSPYFLVHSAIF